MLSVAFGVAQKLDYISHNPWKDVDLVPPSYDKEAPKVFEDEEIPRLFEALEEVNKQVLS